MHQKYTIQYSMCFWALQNILASLYDTSPRPFNFCNTPHLMFVQHVLYLLPFTQTDTVFCRDNCNSATRCNSYKHTKQTHSNNYSNRGSFYNNVHMLLPLFKHRCGKYSNLTITWYSQTILSHYFHNRVWAPLVSLLFKEWNLTNLSSTWWNEIKIT